MGSSPVGEAHTLDLPKPMVASARSVLMVALVVVSWVSADRSVVHSGSRNDMALTALPGDDMATHSPAPSLTAPLSWTGTAGALSIQQQQLQLLRGGGATLSRLLPILL